MESVYELLTARASELHQHIKQNVPPQRTVIAMAGPPGSGKSTIAEEVVRRLNETAARPYAAVLPMDGFHYPRQLLDTFPNREEAYACRGAPWTFDADCVVELVYALCARKDKQLEPIYAPNFDHLQKDPVPDAIAIMPDISLVILEGNWLLLDRDPWRTIATLVHDTWFVDVAPNMARYRVAKRHLKSGIENTWKRAVERAETNDMRNGNLVRNLLVKPAITVESVEAPEHKRRED